MPKTNEEILAHFTSQEVKNWFEKQIKAGLPLAELVNKYEEQGYVLQNYGFLVRQPFTETDLEDVGFTIIDIVCLRPSTLHSRDLHEAVRVTGGQGLYFNNIKNWRELKAGNSIFVPKNTEHAWMTGRTNPLEIQVIYSGILAESAETEFMTFSGFSDFLYKWFSGDMAPERNKNLIGKYQIEEKA